MSVLRSVLWRSALKYALRSPVSSTLFSGLLRFFGGGPSPQPPALFFFGAAPVVPVSMRFPAKSKAWITTSCSLFPIPPACAAWRLSSSACAISFLYLSIFLRSFAFIALAASLLALASNSSFDAEGTLSVVRLLSPSEVSVLSPAWVFPPPPPYRKSLRARASAASFSFACLCFLARSSIACASSISFCRCFTASCCCGTSRPAQSRSPFPWVSRSSGSRPRAVTFFPLSLPSSTLISRPRSLSRCLSSPRQSLRFLSRPLSRFLVLS
mmetsp:Transcript_22833/g.35863  ORF Transcript_22833/g.35863 Transcript_22833/m.35863 type:complete len:269 (+) Transcript_22833:1019-1825(+)